MSDLAATWEGVLADFQARIDLATQCLDEGRELDLSLLAAWTPPTGLGPLPSHLRERAISISGQQTALEARISEEMGKIRVELQKPQNAPRKAALFAEKDIPKFFDSAV